MELTPNPSLTCRCGAEKPARNVLCRHCWIVLPFVVRRNFVKAPIETRRGHLREIFRLSDAARAGAAPTPPIACTD